MTRKRFLDSGHAADDMLKAIGKMSAKELKDFAEEHGIEINYHDAKYEIWSKCHRFLKDLQQ